MTDDNAQNARPAASPGKSRQIRPGIMSRIRTYFLTGLVVAGPVAVTLWLIWWFVTWVDNLVRPFIPRGLPAGNLSAGEYSGPRPDHRLRRADAARAFSPPI